MNFQEELQSKLTTADEAVKVIKDGDWLDYGWVTATVDTLDKALAKRMPELHDVNIRGGIIMRRPAIADIENPADHFTWNSLHMSGIERKMIKEGFCYYIPVRYSEVPSYFANCLPPVDVAMSVVAPMDKHGFFNFGPNGSHTLQVMKKAKHVIVEVNENMPVCFGGYDNCVHISDVDAVVMTDNPPIPTNPPAGEPSDVDLAVAKLVVPEIPNGACLQLGIGSMPNAIGTMIAESDLKDLGVHTEMYVDAFVALSKAGKITGAKKPFDRGRQVYAFGSGTQELYDFLDHNPECMTAPVDYVNSIKTVQQIDNFISINGAVDIDLYGQISAETSGTKHISGAGGQQDFVMGAYLSNGGKSFICCSSTVKNKKTGEVTSRIRPTMKEGTIATCTRSNTHYVVTEYGKVNLKGLATWQRAEALIGIAHPDFREDLIKEAEAMHIWRKSNKR
ncbi:MAG: butyryl-CoA:acetate CoA-transferase [Anaerovoracaceae bacterium]|jgi:butyryl-CoA:acetate CoA-transferase